MPALKWVVFFLLLYATYLIIENELNKKAVFLDGFPTNVFLIDIATGLFEKGEQISYIEFITNSHT